MGSIGVVVDTNVFVSALGFGGTPLEALLRTFDEDVQLLVSADTLDELDRVMSYERLPFTGAERERFLNVLRREAEVIEPAEEFDIIDGDPDDNRFLEVAVAGGADYLLSGDEHLLDLGQFRDIAILRPAAFIEVE